MPRLIWSPAALGDVQRLYRFLAQKSPDAARRAVKAIRSSVAPLAVHPHLGRTIDGWEPEFREWLVDYGESGYLILYRLEGELVVILAVRHQKEAGY